MCQECICKKLMALNLRYGKNVKVNDNNKGKISCVQKKVARVAWHLLLLLFPSFVGKWCMQNTPKMSDNA